MGAWRQRQPLLRDDSQLLHLDRADHRSGFWQPGLLTEFIVPQAGHSINVDYGAPVFYSETLLWLAEHGL